MNEPAVTEVAPEPELPEDVASAWATVVIDIFEKQKRDDSDTDTSVESADEGGAAE